MNNKQIGVGIIGFGPKTAASTFHVPLISFEPRLKLEVVSIRKPAESIRPLLAETIRLVTSAEEVIEDDGVDLVVVSTPIRFHFEYAKKALNAGKHVIVEKPMCLRVEEADELIKLAREKKLLLCQHHNRRWDGGYLTVKKLFSEDRFGRIVMYETCHDRWEPEVSEKSKSGKIEDGLFYDLSVHSIDQTIELFGRPHAVTATIRQQRSGGKVDDYYHVQLDYGPMQAIIRSNLLSTFHGPRHKVAGTKGGFVKLMTAEGKSDTQADMLNAGILPDNPSYGKDDPKDFGTFSDGVTNNPVETVAGAYQTFYHLVAKALLDGDEQPVPIEDARDSLAIIEAAIRSNDENRTISAQEINFLIKEDTLTT